MRSSADINVVQIPPYLIDAMLPHIEGFLSVGMATGNLDGAKIAAELERGLEQLWVVFRDGVPTGVVLTSINKPSASTL